MEYIALIFVHIGGIVDHHCLTFPFIRGCVVQRKLPLLVLPLKICVINRNILRKRAPSWWDRMVVGFKTTCAICAPYLRELKTKKKTT
jgi:hypothetical protein